MENHYYMLNLFEQFEKAAEQMHTKFFEAIKEPATTYYIEAFFDGNLEWTEWAYDKDELQRLINDAIESGCTFAVKEYGSDEI
ncbi:MAG: hypothetical protein Unbinned1819contig1001_53 [Prokaryotic dsDNA virus sp.]|nr:MAG: hypothetical protein Unbinned1819contig1001_53 [Prokaryotic dsDNA virus sp.]|tara:strand:+ start:29824 stop:30072 length:249 start_codon:yes stop_codon:yes gene_type:complete